MISFKLGFFEIQWKPSMRNCRYSPGRVYNSKMELVTIYMTVDHDMISCVVIYGDCIIFADKRKSCIPIYVKIGIKILLEKHGPTNEYRVIRS